VPEPGEYSGRIGEDHLGDAAEGPSERTYDIGPR
jgi:hypothetical protein